MVCKNCGASPPDGSAFCMICGGKMEPADIAVSPGMQHVAPSPPTYNPPDYSALSTFDSKNDPAQTRQMGLNERHSPGLVRTAVSIAICLIVFAILCAGTTLYILRDTLLGLPEMIQNADIAQFANRTSLVDAVLEQITPETARRYNINVGSIEKLLSRSSINDSLSSVVSNYLEAAMSGDMGYHISARDIIQLLKKNEAAIRTEFGYEFSQRDYESIEDYIRDEVALEDYSIGEFFNSAEIPAELPTLAASLMPLIAMGLLCAVLAFDVFAINRKGIRWALLQLGITVGVAGLLFIVAMILLPIIVPSVVRSILFTSPVDITLNMLFVGVLLLGTGVLAVVAYFIIRTVRGAPRPQRPGRSNALLIAVVAVHVVLVLSLGVMTSMVFRDLADIRASIVSRR